MAEMNSEQKLKVCSVNSIGPYLEIAGQLNDCDLDKKLSRIRQLVPTCFEFSAKWPEQYQKSLLFPGAFCIFKQQVNGEGPSEYEFLRARIHSPPAPGQVATTTRVEVELLDYGYKSIVNSTDLLFSKNPQLLENLPLLCTKFILLGICNDWKQPDLDKVSNIITSETIDVSVKHEFCNHKLATFMWKNFNLAEFLMHQKKIGVAVEYDLQVDHLKKIFDENFEHVNNMKNNSNTNVGNGGNNNIPRDGKTPTDIAREQILAQRSLSARLNKHRQPQGDNSPQSSPIPLETQMPLMEINNVMRNPTAPNLVLLSAAALSLSGKTRPVPRPNFHMPYNPLQQQQQQQQMKTAPMDIYKMRYGPPQQHVGQVSALKNYDTRNVAPPPVDFKPTNVVASFKTSTLVVGETYDVSITFVENGPYAFSVQLRIFHEELLSMMKKLEEVKLQPILTVPNLGMACLARYSEDHHVYRALVSRNYQDSCRVLYVDYGNSETVPFKDIYVIPNEFLEAKPYSMRFTLSGAKQLEPIDDSLKKAFKDFVMFNYFKLTVMPLEGPPLVQYCQLLRNGVNVMETLSEIKQSRTIYPKAEPLKDNDSVEIRYIQTPRNFYVQKAENFETFQKLMDEMFIYYNKNQNVPNEIFLGAPCIVRYDNEWYRAEVMRADDKAIIVRHVDFGYEQVVTKHLLSTISDKHVKMPRQAVQCCLKGFDNNEMNISSATSQFEMLAEESNETRRLFNVRVYRIQPDGLNIVNLLSPNLNVMKKLFKLSMPFEKYLTIEKDININEQSSHVSVNGSQISQYTNKNGGKSNQQYDKKSPQKPHQHQQQQQQHQRNNKINNFKNDGGGDKSNSSTSSRDNRDSRSNSSELQRQHGGSGAASAGGKRQSPPQQQQQKQRKDDNNQKSLDNSFDSRSSNDDNKSTGSSKKQVNGNGSDTLKPPPRFQNGKQEATNNLRFNKNHQQSPPHKKQYPEQSQQLRQHQQQQPPHQQQQNHHQQQPHQQQQNHQQPPLQQQQNHHQQQPPLQQQQNHHQQQPPLQQQQNHHQLQQHQQQQNHNQRQQQQQQQQQRQNQRPRNAPKGFSQNPQRQKSNLNPTSLTKKYNANNPSDVRKRDIYVQLDHEFPTEDLKLNSEVEVNLCWWSSPFQFYIRILSQQMVYSNLHTEIYNFYKYKPHQQLSLKVGSNVMARYRKENSIMRARVISCNHMTRKYNVFFVDLGAQCIVTSEDVWRVEKRFSQQPCMAFRCSFEGITYNYDQYYLIDRIEKYLNGNSVKCVLYKRKNDTYYANVIAGDVDLKKTLISNGFVSIVSNETHLSLLVGQQIRGNFTNIKDMLNFKIEFHSFGKKMEALCAFEDVLFVKSNAEISKKFEKFYTGKTCIFNINDVSEDNILLVRPMMPLFKEDIHTNICTLPVALDSFEAHIVHVEAFYRFYVHPVLEKERLKSFQNRMRKFYENSGSPLRKFNKDAICAAKSKDNQWYRARIISSAKNSTKVHFIDYGNQENIENKHFKMLGEQFYNFEIAAIEINLPIGRVTAEAVALAEIEKQKDQLFIIQPIEARKNRIIADMKIASSNQCLIEIMKSALVKDRDIEFMRKLLEKEKSSRLEYIETVDLTMEDEDDDNKGQQKMAAAASSLPKEEKNDEPKEPEEDKTIEKINDDEVESINSEVVETFKEKAKTSTPEPQNLQNDVETQKEEVENYETAPSQSSSPDDLFAYMEIGVLSHCDSPTQFYIHPNDKVGTLYRLQENLQIVSCSLPQLTNKVKGAQCISMYSVDKQWYRAKIMDAELMVLQFIDYGNTDCVSDTAEIKESLWSNLEPHCIACALPICAKGTTEFVDAANDIFNNSYQKKLHFEYLTRSNGDFNKKQYINLYVDGVNIAEKLINDGYAKPLQVVTSGEDCFISHMNSISNFYIQYERDSQAIHLIDQYMTNAMEEFEPLKEFEKSRIVAALYSEDNRWYRAKLLREVPGQGYKVIFIDYGNTGVTPECRLLSEEIANVPAMSRKCEIELPEDRLAWSDEAEAKFKEISAGEPIFTVELRKPALDRAIVHILIDDHNIIDDLAPLCAEKTKNSDNEYYFSSNNTSLQTSSIEKNNCKLSADVIHVKSPNNFYVQFDKDKEQINLIKNNLKSIEPEILAPIDVKIGEIYATRTNFDGPFYRIRTTEMLPSEDEMENEWRVDLIDFGDENIVTELYQLPEDIKQIPAIVKQCCLEPSSKFDQFPMASTQTFNALLESCNYSVLLEYVDCEAVPAMVKLFSNDAKALNISQNLHKLLETAESAPVEKLLSSSSPAAASAPIFRTKCLVSHVNSPNDFYIQLLRHTKDIEYVTETLKVSQLDGLEDDITEDSYAVCYAPEEDCHCRCQIKKIINEGEEEGRRYEVFLIDIGSVIATTDLFNLPGKICGLPPLAIKCSLSDLPEDVDADKLKTVFVALIDAHFGEVFEVNEDQLKSKSPKKIVNLQFDYKDLTAELIKSLSGIELSPEPTLYDCTIIQFNSSASFYLQLEKDIPALEKVTDKLLDAEKLFTPCDHIEIGNIYAAQSIDDQVYYRGIPTKSLQNGGFEVKLIDFANTIISEKFLALPNDLKELQPYCIHCRLDHSSIAKCDGVKLQRFIDGKCSDVFQAEMLTINEPSCIVRLFYKGKNILSLSEAN